MDSSSASPSSSSSYSSPRAPLASLSTQPLSNIQSYLAGVPYVVVGFRNDAGILVRTERLQTQDITQRVKMKNYWQGGVCLAFADDVLCWLFGTVRENEDYILQFVHPFQRLVLLRAQSCPDEITQHVEQL